MQSFKIDGYTISGIIAKGSISKILLAEKENSSEKVIIKAIKCNKRTPHRIISESEIPKLVSHPNIVKIIDFIQSDTHAFIIYPCLHKSVPLSKIKQQNLKSFPIQTLYTMVDILCQVSDAIEFIHSNNIIHRDIKPENIIISDERVQLIDFDLSSVVNNEKYPIRKGLIGTADYIAPEIWRSEENINYFAADIYSFGVTIYFVFNKKTLPYPADTIENLEYAINYDKPLHSISGYRTFDKFIMKILDKNPSNRPSIRSIRHALQNLMCGQLRFQL